MNVVKEREKEVWKTEYARLVECCKGDEFAAMYISNIFRVSQLIDDLVDEKGGALEERMLWGMETWKILMIDIPANPFFQHFREQLSASFLTSAGDWMLSTYLENGDKVQKVWAHILRDGLESHLQFVAYLVGGLEHGYKARVGTYHVNHPPQHNIEEFKEFTGELS